MNDYGLSVRRLASVAGVTERTARRWKQRGRIPEPYQTALRARLGNDTGLASPAWKGWRFNNDTLISPEGVSYTPGEIRATPLMQRALAVYRQERSRAQSEKAAARDLCDATDDLLTALDGLIRCAQHLKQLLTNPRNGRHRSNVATDNRNSSSSQDSILLRIASPSR
jgi:hypothetical protein